MHTDKEVFEKILSKYSKVVDPGMLEGTVQYAYDFVEKIPLVKREAFQVTLDLVGEKRPAAKQAQPNHSTITAWPRSSSRKVFSNRCGDKSRSRKQGHAKYGTVMMGI
ncbi:MAG: hypothetical protein ACM3N3_21445 [Betaproteobacteria bacterium]